MPCPVQPLGLCIHSYLHLGAPLPVLTLLLFSFPDKVLPPPPGRPHHLDTRAHSIPHQSAHSVRILLSMCMCQAPSLPLLWSLAAKLLPSPLSHPPMIPTSPNSNSMKTEPGPCSPPDPRPIAVGYKFSVSASECAPVIPVGGSPAKIPGNRICLTPEQGVLCQF